MKTGCIACLSFALVLVAPFVWADTPNDSAPTDDRRDAWTKRFDEARLRMEDGDYALASTELRELAAIAPSETDRVRATELAEVCEASARRHKSVDPTIRSTDELWVGYGHAFLYGLGTGTWFAFQVHPSFVGGLFLPVVGFSAASVGALALTDALRPLPYGMPHAISSGLEVGLVEGVWIALAQRAHAQHANERVWHAETTSTLLWSTSTVGGIAGGLVGAFRFRVRSRSGRVRFSRWVRQASIQTRRRVPSMRSSLATSATTRDCS
jgi:hypothetical protein